VRLSVVSIPTLWESSSRFSACLVNDFSRVRRLLPPPTSLLLDAVAIYLHYIYPKTRWYPWLASKQLG